MKRLIVVLMLVSLGAVHAPTPSPDGQSAESEAAWLEDIEYLRERLDSVHPDPYYHTPRESFDAAFTALETDLPGLSDAEIVARLMQIIALIRDSHTGLPPTLQPVYPFTFYPLHFYRFSDGTFLVDAPPEYEAAIGGRLVSVGEIDAEAAFERLKTLSNYDNASTVLFNAPLLLTVAELLLGAHLIDDVTQPTFVLELPGGEQMTLNPAPEPWEQASAGGTPFGLPPRDEPLYLSRRDETFWMAGLDGDAALYIQHNAVQETDSTGRSVSAFAREVEAWRTDHPGARVILDLRHNSGGDVAYARPLLNVFRQDDFFQQPGSLIVLIGRNTFSAAVILCVWLEQAVNPVFIGEPTGGQPHSFENALTVTLPNSQLQILIARRRRADVEEGDERPAIEPHLAVSLSSADFFEGRDPVLDAALAYPRRRSPRTETRRG